MAQIHNLFLDDGGVITDDAGRQERYRRLVGEFFCPRLGGLPDSWSDANRTVFPQAWRRLMERLESWDRAGDYLHEMDLYHLDWLRTMSAAVGVEAPTSDQDCVLLA